METISRFDLAIVRTNNATFYSCSFSLFFGIAEKYPWEGKRIGIAGSGEEELYVKGKL